MDGGFAHRPVGHVRRRGCLSSSPISTRARDSRLGGVSGRPRPSLLGGAGSGRPMDNAGDRFRRSTRYPRALPLVAAPELSGRSPRNCMHSFGPIVFFDRRHVFPRQCILAGAPYRRRGSGAGGTLAAAIPTYPEILPRAASMTATERDVISEIQRILHETMDGSVSVDSTSSV